MAVFFLKRGSTPTIGKRASDYSIGDIIHIKEGGSYVDFRVVHQGKPSSLYDDSCLGTWCLRKEIISLQDYDKTGYYFNLYQSSIFSYLKDTVYPTLGALEKASIKTIKLPSNATDQNGAKLILLSGYEIGFTQQVTPLLPVDGSKLDYFIEGDSATARNMRIMNYNGQPSAWWTRSKATNSNNTFFVVGGGSGGSWNYMPPNAGALGVLYAMVINSDTLFDSATNKIKG